jgi:glutathione S-transferase
MRRVNGEVGARRVGKAAEAQIAGWQKKGDRALAVMESRPGTNRWLAGARCSVADIALCADTRVADEGGFDLEPYPGIRAMEGGFFHRSSGAAGRHRRQAAPPPRCS